MAIPSERRSRAHLPRVYEDIGRLNTICPYFTMFPLGFPFAQLRKAARGDWVLDPFCGRGTTLYAARLHGLRSVGVDCSRVATAIALAKFTEVDADDVSRLSQQILRTRTPEHLPTGDFWSRCYSSVTLRQICAIRESLLSRCDSPARIALRALMLGLLHGPRTKGLPSYLSNQMPRTYATKPHAAIRYWKKHRLTPPKVDVVDLIERRAQYVFERTPQKVGGRVLLMDSRHLHRRFPTPRFRWVVTSPPYLGMRTYVPDQWLRGWFLGSPDTVDYDAAAQVAASPCKSFGQALSDVWHSVARVCVPGARLIVRFGAIRSAKIDPTVVLRDSLVGSNWRILTICDAGLPPLNRRQASQFRLAPICRRAIREIDLHAILVGSC